MSIYDKQGQRIFFQRETTYGNIYDPESQIAAFTQVPADYAHWRRLDIIEDTFNVSVPLLDKLKKFDIQDAKHASAVLSGNYEPVDVSFEMTAQGLEFLPCAVGTPALISHDQAMIQTITCVGDVASNLNETYLLIDSINTNITKHFLIWIDVNTTGSAPTVTGIHADNRYEADIAVGANAATVATEIAATIHALADFTASSDGAVVTVTHVADGAVQMAHNGAASPGFEYGVDVRGSTKYTVTESVTTILPSFTFHYEQRNDTTEEDIVYDLFGCVIDNISVNLIYGDKIAKYSITFKCPYAVAGLRNTNNPPRKYITGFPTMSSMQESIDSWLLQEDGFSTTTAQTQEDRTPQQVDSVVLSIKNAIEFKGDLSKRYKNLAVAGNREITLQIIGNTTEKELFQYFLEEFTNDGTDWYPTSANGRLNSVWKVQRDGTFDYITIAFYNWICLEHNFSFVSVEDAVKSVDITLQDGSSNSSGLIITSFIYQSYIDETILIG